MTAACSHIASLECRIKGQKLKGDRWCFGFICRHFLLAKQQWSFFLIGISVIKWSAKMTDRSCFWVCYHFYRFDFEERCCFGQNNAYKDFIFPQYLKKKITSTELWTCITSLLMHSCIYVQVHFLLKKSKMPGFSKLLFYSTFCVITSISKA